MALKLSEGDGKKRELTPSGTHPAICTKIIDLGTHRFEFQGKKKELHKVLIGWELPTEFDSEGRPFQISAEFTASLHENSNLRPFLTTWRGKPFTAEELAGFDMDSFLGKPCLVSIVHEKSKQGKQYAKVNSATRLPKGMPAPKTESDLIFYQMEDGDPPSNLPEWIKEKINQSIERSEAFGEDEDEDEDDGPLYTSVRDDQDDKPY